MTTLIKSWPPVNAHKIEGTEAHAHPSRAIRANTAPTNVDIFSTQYVGQIDREDHDHEPGILPYVISKMMLPHVLPYPETSSCGLGTGPTFPLC